MNHRRVWRSRPWSRHTSTGEGLALGVVLWTIGSPGSNTLTYTFTVPYDRPPKGQSLGFTAVEAPPLIRRGRLYLSNPPLPGWLLARPFLPTPDCGDSVWSLRLCDSRVSVSAPPRRASLPTFRSQVVSEPPAPLVPSTSDPPSPGRTTRLFLDLG